MTFDDATFGARPPELRTEVPGPRSRALAARLRAVESRNVTWLGEDFPVFWDEALGANVRDADGNVFVDLTAAFGVALAGHRPPAVVEAVTRQAGALLHGMGDVHPPAAKVEALEAIARLLPWPDTRSVLAGGGAEAVEIALKTATLATGRPGVIAFRGGYHGLTSGALAATARPYFREPFRRTLGDHVTWLPYPGTEPGPDAPDPFTTAETIACLRAMLEGGIERPGSGPVPVGAILIEPVQARGGVRVLPDDVARGLNALRDEFEVLLIADEIYAGLGRCGAVLASTRVGLDPDLVCIGKALAGGMPVGVCSGPSDVMDAWPQSPGEALHTSTFLGHPVVSAAIAAMAREISEHDLPARAEALGGRLRSELVRRLGDHPRVGPVRGLGLLLGFDVLDPDGRPLPGGGFEVAKAALRRGLILLPAGDRGEVLELSPPAVLGEELVLDAVDRLAGAVVEVLGDPS